MAQIPTRQRILALQKLWKHEGTGYNLWHPALLHAPMASSGNRQRGLLLSTGLGPACVLALCAVGLCSCARFPPWSVPCWLSCSRTASNFQVQNSAYSRKGSAKGNISTRTISRGTRNILIHKCIDSYSLAMLHRLQGHCGLHRSSTGPSVHHAWCAGASCGRGCGASSTAQARATGQGGCCRARCPRHSTCPPQPSVRTCTYTHTYIHTLHTSHA